MDALRQLYFDAVARSHALVDAAYAGAPLRDEMLAALVATTAWLAPSCTASCSTGLGWIWLAFAAIVVLLLAFDLGVLHRKSHEIGVAESLWLSAGYIGVAFLFGAWVWCSLGSEAGMEYLTGFFVEKSLAMDNVFVIALILGYFAIPRQYQHRVLFWGILGVIVLRGSHDRPGRRAGHRVRVDPLRLRRLPDRHRRQDAADRATRSRSIDDNPLLRFLRRRLHVTAELHGEQFFVQPAGPGDRAASLLWITPLFLALVLIEVADLIFAVDSVPAIFAITHRPVHRLHLATSSPSSACARCTSRWPP